MTNSAPDIVSISKPALLLDVGRWAPVCVVLFVAFWPLPGLAATVLTLSALLASYYLIRYRFRGGTQLLDSPAWALTSVLFMAYWLPQVVSLFGALELSESLLKVATDLRYLPFMWLCAIAVGGPERRERTFKGLAVIGLIWTLDALAQAVLRTSPLFWSLNQLKQAISGYGFCSTQQMMLADRLSGIFGPCNLKLGQTLATLSPFVLFAMQRRGVALWLLVVAVLGIVLLLAGSRASWITYGLILMLSGWRVLGIRRLLGMGALFLPLVLAVIAFSPQTRERIDRTAAVFADHGAGVDQALSGRSQIWQAALCMIQAHPLSGVGVRGFRDAYPACNPTPERIPAWGAGPALHAHQIVLEILSETGVIGLLLWIAGAAMAWRAWCYATAAARDRARPAMISLLATVFPFNTHLAFYSSFWGALMLMLAGLYAGALLQNGVIKKT
ncbi:O-antigen ligase family protein [Xylella fastidiosa]|uniref:O-antigen ligase family protein n=1 Tax=Xylella fastidiosa subsp. multiplex TaxID=644357 RepID=A0A9Q4QT99_XYLFS|nr:O-antigen ligase [Xylella fastidiosa]ERI60530.1 membrane protein [Xylella fastidiosa subsp. multiplex Griffin-1]ACA11123.1 membrane protein [Xylella fastidiosa M12]KAJ4853917.1 O-antigen ligase family protein [Xylella fastidiosa subsp. multiplex]MBE0268043.1 O-antigen ligase family protein [Xylella fastidiosa subsp. multiplex]MBE0274716.1 O-antigen ligase family protein [Xylella fastidiosa subsp. multiplex]